MLERRREASTVSAEVGAMSLTGSLSGEVARWSLHEDATDVAGQLTHKDDETLGSIPIGHHLDDVQIGICFEMPLHTAV